MRHTVSERRKKWFFLRSMFRAFWEHLDKHNGQRRSKTVSRPLFAEALEARVLFSAAPVPVEQEQPVEEAPVAQEAEMQQGQVAGQTGLSQAQLDGIVAAAKQRWIDSGISQAQLDALNSVTYQIADLGSNQLAYSAGSTITVDIDAGGGGTWFVDVTPDLDEEFSLSDGRYRAITNDAGNAIDLLTLIIHEQGHVLGLEDLASGTGDLMGGVINAGERRLPYSGQALSTAPLSLDGRHFALTTASVVGTTLTYISDSASDELRIRINAGNFEHSLNGAAFTISGAVAGVTDILIDMGDGNDVVIIESLGSLDSNLTINGGTGDDTVTLEGDVTFAAGRSLNVDLQDDDASPGTDTVNFGANANLLLSGAGTATVKASRNVAFASGSSLVTVDGAIVIEANQQGTATSGNFSGVSVNSALVQATGTGTVTVLGRGGNDAAGGQLGVVIDGGGDIVGSTNGTVTVAGIGGASSGDGNYGVYVNSTGSAITSGGGAVSVSGTGGGSGASTQNFGVYVNFGADILAGGAGSVTVTGQGGNSTGATPSNHGVRVNQTGSIITSTGGNVSVTGTGGTGDSSNYGVSVESGASISSGGSTTVAVSGQGGSGTGTDNIGVRVAGTSASISSGGGGVTVTGIEGGGTSRFGVVVQDTSSIAGGGGAITLVADSMDFSTGTPSVSASGNNVTLRQRTNGTQINLGAADSAGVLGLTDAELDRVTAGTIQIGDSNSGAITVSAAITRAAATALSLTTGANQNIAFSGAGSLSSANGNVTLTTSGSGAITSGTATTDIAAGTGTISLNAGSGGIGASGNGIAFSSTGLTTATSGNGNQFLSGSATIGAAGLDAGTGSINLESGTLTLGGSDRIANASDVVISGGATLALGANNDTIDQLVLVNGTVSGTTGTLTGTSDFDVRQGTISARIGGSVGLTKTSANTVILSGSNTYTGDTLVSAGTLEHNNSNAVSAGTITLAGTNAALTIGTGFNGARPLVISDIGDVKSLNLAGPGSSYSGTITIEENTKGNFFIGRPSGTDGNIFSKLTGTGQAGVSLFGLGNTERGYNFWNGTSDYTGPILINRGLARALATNAMGLGTIEIASATSGAGLELGDGVDLANNIVVNAGTGGIALANGASSATVSGNIAANFAFGLGYINYFDSTDTLTVTGTISGNGLVSTEGAGTVVLTGNNSYTGGTNVRGAALRVNHSNALGTNTVTLAPGSNTTLTLADGVNVANALVISNTGDSKRITTVDGGAATYSGTIQIQETTVGNFAVRPPDAGSSLTLSGDISGTGGAGIGYGGAGGTVIVSGNNSYTGGTRIDIATVRAGHNNALSTSGTVTLQNTAILELADGVSVARALSVSDTGGQKILRLHSTATSATYSGAVTIAETTQNNFDLSASSGQTLTLSGDIDGSGGAGIEKIGDGTVVLSGNNSYTGITNVTAGILRAANANALGSAAQGTVVPNGSQLELAGGVTVAGESLTISGSGTNFIGALQSQSGANTWSGNVLLGLDNTRIGANGIGQTLTVNGVIDDGAGTFNFAVRNADAGGTTVIGGANTYGGNTDVIVGTLQLAAGSNRIPAGTTVRLGNGTNTGSATLDLNGQNQEVGAIVTVGTSMPMSVTNSGTSTLTYHVATDQSFSGTFAGGLSLIKTGAATLTLTGVNSYSGTTTISQGILDIDGTHTGGGTFSIAGGATLRGSGSITANILGAPGSAIVSDGNFVIGNIASASGFETSGTVTIGAGNSLTINDSNLAVLGTSTVVNGTLTKGGAQGFSLSAGETLSGHGTISGAVTTNTGTIAPGNSPGILATGNLNLDGGTYNVELGGTTPGNLASNHDQIAVTGSVTLGAGTATLNIAAINGFVPTATNSFVIIANDGTDAVSGTFAGLAEGASFTSGGNTYTISYRGGDGNDVVLFGGASQTEISLSGSSLVIADSNGGASNDRLTIRFDSGTNEYVISDSNLVLTQGASLPGSSFTRPDGNTIRVAAAGITDLVVNGLGGDDFLTIDLSTGALPVNVVFNGGMEATAAGDGLRVVGSGTQSAVYTPHATIAGNGLITLGSQTVTFTGLEPVDFDSLASVTVTLPGANDVLTVANGFDAATGLLPAVVVSGTSNAVAIEAAHIRNVGTVIIDTTTVDGNDLITVTNANNVHGIGNFSILTGTGTDTVNVNGAVTVSGDLTITTRALRVNTGAHLTSSGGGNISLTGTAPTSGGIRITSANLTTSGTGAIIVSGTGGDADGESGLHLQTSTVTAGSGGITFSGLVSDLVSGDDGITMDSVVLSTSGAISLTGTGGNRIGDSHGIEITGASDMSAAAGITLAGTSGDGGVLFNASSGAGLYDIETTSGDISITGTRTDGTGSLDIVRIVNARVDTDAGLVSIIGQSTAPGSGSTGWGVTLTGDSDLEATTGITLTGNTGGGGGVNFNVTGAGNAITTTAGDILITGSGATNFGVRLVHGTAMAISTSAASVITISGTGGDGDNEDGVEIQNAAVSTGSGNITVTGQVGDNLGEDGVGFSNVTLSTSGAISVSGTGGNRSGDSHGIEIAGASDLSAGTGITLTGTSGDGGVQFSVSGGAGLYDIETTSGNISITGTRNDGAGSLDIVLISNARVDTNSGSISIVGQSTAPGAGSLGWGVNISDDSDLEATTGIALTGNTGGGGGVRFNVTGAGNAITTDGGDISITGTGSSLFGVLLSHNVGFAVSTSGASAITISGTGGDGDNEDGVEILNAAVSTGSGNITITGQADTALGEDGIGFNHVTLATTGAISLTGTGGNRSNESHGIEITGNSDLSAGTGITLSGTSGEGGVLFSVSAGSGLYDIETTIGNISITGTRSDNTGVSDIVLINNARVDTNAGSVSIVGTSTSPGTGSGGWGVNLTNDTDIEATTGITLTGNTGGGGGVRFSVVGAGNAITTTGGDISITGTGESLPGVNLTNSSGAWDLSTGGASSITITGTGGNGSTEDGVTLVSANVSTGSGNITVSGQVGTTAGDDGVGMNDVLIATTGAISLTGTGGNRSSESYGIDITGNSDLSAGTGITLAGTSGEGGVLFSVSAGAGLYDIETATGNISITGTRNDDVGTLDIVLISNARVDTGSGSVSVVGSSTVVGASSALWGVNLIGDTDIEATTGITLSGNSGGGGGVQFAVSGVGNEITTTGGDVSITGTGLGLHGVRLVNSTGAWALSTGGSSSITISGTGGNSSTEDGLELVNANVSTGTGNISLSGQVGSAAGEDGVEISNVSIATTGSGTVTITGTGGDRADSQGVTIVGSSTVTTASGSLTITGNAANTSGTRTDLQILGSASVSSTSGMVTITGDEISLGSVAPKVVSALGNHLRVQPFTDAGTIGIGNGATGALLANVAFLNKLEISDAHTLTIGRNTGTGNVDIRPLNRSAEGEDFHFIGGNINVNTLNIGTNNLTLTSNTGAITDASGTDLTAANVTLNGTVTPGQSPGILVIAGNATINNGVTFEFDGNAGAGLVNGHDRIDVTGTVTLNATTSTVTIDTTDLINTEIAAGDEIILINNDGADAVTGTFSNAPLVRNLVNSNVAGTNLDLVLRYNGGDGNDVSFLVGNVTTRVFVDGSGNLVIEDIDDTTNDQITVQVVGANLVITEADTNIFIDALGFTGDLTNQVTVPLASFTGNVILRLGGGNDAIVFDDVDLTGTRGLTVEDGAGTDTVTFQTNSSDLANGNVNVAADTINVNVALSAGTAGNIALNATTGNLALNANLATGGAGLIDLDAGGTITQAAATTIAAGSGAITLDAAGAITLTGISTTGNITATSTGGAILDAGDVNTDLTAANVTLSGTAIGASGNAISTTTTTLTTNTSGAGGNQFLTETDSLTAINLAAGAGTINLTTGGSITDSDGAADLTAASVVVTVTSGDFGAVGNAIGTTVASLSVNTAAGNGSQWISETDGLTAISLDAGSGNVTLSAGGVITDTDVVPFDVIATSLAVTSAGFGTAGNVIGTQVTNFEANGGAGGIFVANNGNLAIGGVSASLSGLDTAAGGILIRITGTLTTSEAIDATGGEVRLVANSMALGSTVASSGGNLILAPFVGSTTIGVGGGSGTLNLDDAELALLTDGFSSITIGDASFGTGVVDVDSSTFTDNVTIVGGSVAVTDLNAGTNNATVIARTGAITDGGDAGTDVTAALVTLNANGAIGASGDAISIAATSISTNSNLIAANGNQFLTTATSVAVTGFNAGTGTIEISGGEFDLTANNVVNDATIIAIETGTTLDADGTDTFAGVTVRSGGILKGDGNLQTTPVTALAGGTITPGEGASGAGDLGTGTLTLNPSAVYSVNINGNTAVTQYDQLVVTGTVNLGNATLSLAPLGYVPTAGHTYTLISNDGVDPVVGIFAGLIEGSYVSASVINGTPPPAFLPDQLFQISYVGGDGNDVVLTAAAVIATTNIRLDGSGNLLVEDILGGSTDDNLSISRVGSNFVIEDLGGNPLGTLIPGATQPTLSRVQVPVALVTGGILVNTLGGNDIINLDGFSGAASFGSYLIVDGGAGIDTINVNADLTTTGADGTNRSVDLQGDIILVDAGVDLVTSSAAGTVSLVANRNIFMDGNSRIQTVGGDIALSANLAGTETGNFVGIQIRGGDLSSTTGNVSLTGRGGTTGNTNRGISIDFDTATSSTTEIATAGSVTLNGTGGAGGQQGTGVFIDRGTVQSTGAGPVTITGTGGAGTQSNDGISIFSGFVDAGSGNLSLTGTGASTGSFNRGIVGFSSWLISAGGNVSVLGSGGGTALSAAYSLGVEVVDSVVGTFGTGTITLHGTGANGTQHNVGLKVHSTSVQGENGLIDLRGTGQGNNVSNVGLQILAGADVVSTGTGNINLDGTGSTTGTTSNHGVEIASDSVLRVANGNLTIDGTGNGTLQAGKGVVLSVSLLETTGSGDIFVNGTGSANTTLGTSRGIEAVTGRIRSTGTGDITLIGTGGTGTSLNQGVVLASTTTISTASGDLTIRGNGGGAGATSGGVHVHASSNLSVGGSGNLTILGTGALGTNSNEGVQISSTSVVTTVNGALVVTGTGRGTGQLNSGVLLSNSTLSSTGTGNLIITGAGTSSAATGSNNKGITMSGGALNTVSGNLVLVGTGGRGVSTNEGIRIASAALRSTGGGSLSLTGAAVGTTTGTQNTGVFLTSVTLDSSGSKTIIGTGGGGTATSSNHGVYMQTMVIPLGPVPSVTGTKGAGTASKDTTGNFFP